MSADEFWKDDPQLFVSYRISFINRKEREVEETDYKSWLQGLYIHDGNTKLFDSLKQYISNILASFSKKSKNNAKVGEYPNKPYNELAKEKKTANEKKKKEQRYKEFEESLVYFGTMKQRYLEQMKKKGEDNNAR